jgi:hypothetical protein
MGVVSRLRHYKNDPAKPYEFVSMVEGTAEERGHLNSRRGRLQTPMFTQSYQYNVPSI